MYGRTGHGDPTGLDRIHSHRVRDVLEVLLSEIDELVLEPITHLAISVL
jgi:hypothetical protein